MTNTLVVPDARTLRPERPVSTDLWWQRERLHYRGHDLWFAERCVRELAENHGAPLLVYDRRRIQANIGRLAAALAGTGQPHRVYFATKSNRFGPVLDAVRDSRRCGIDCASPGEVELALAHGFRPEHISFTASAVSDADIERIGGLGIRINVDSISMLHKLGRRFPGRRIGLRINPQIGVGLSGNLTYAGSRPSKFGIYADRFHEALDVARGYGFIVEGVHMHVGSGWLARGLETFLRAVRRLADFAEQLPDLAYVNVGGGIGVPHAATDQPVDLDLYASAIAEVVRERLGDHIEICCEPGDYIINDSSILVAQVTMVEEKGGETFVGLNVGFNAHPQAAHYGFVQEIIHAHRGPARSDDNHYFVVGNINEVIDNFDEDARLPDVQEGDFLVMLNAGGYGSSMASFHCMRQPARELMLD
ncbi:MAG: diaminopimelate decarboxylase [Deltaproteobacteria bacterium]|nr:MAG: diaminopimelate decarboxylase [Deltaproteobacteria bacterium]